MKKLLLFCLGLAMALTTKAQCDVFIQHSPTGNPNEVDFLAWHTDSTLSGSYDWDFAGIETAVSAAAIVTFPGPGTYPVVVNFVSSDSTCMEHDSVFVVIDSVPPGPCDVWINHYQTGNPYEVDFEAYHTDSSLAWTGDYIWDYAGLDTSHGYWGTYTFPGPGTYPVILEFMSFDSACYATDTVMVQVDSMPPVPCDVWINHYGTGNPDEFDFQAWHSDSLLTGNYIWDFAGLDTIHAPGALYTFPGPGTYPVTVQFTSFDSSCIAEDTVIIQLDSMPPPPCDVWINHYGTGNPDEFDFQAWHSDSLLVGHYIWDFAGLDTIHAPGALYTFPGPGTYPVTVQFTSNDSSCIAEDTVIIQLDSMPPPPCDVWINHYGTGNPNEIDFEAYHTDSSLAWTGDYIWDYAGMDTSHGYWGNYTFPGPGTYPVSLQFVSFDSSCTTWDSVSVVIDSMPPTPCDVWINASPTGNPEEFDFHAWHSDSNLVGSYIWDFAGLDSGFAQTEIFTFPGSGVWPVIVHFTSYDSSCMAWDSLAIDITPPPACGFNASATQTDVNEYEFTADNIDTMQMGYFDWDFGDGEFSPSQYTHHRFNSIDTFLVSVSFMSYDSLCFADTSFFVVVDSLPTIACDVMFNATVTDNKVVVQAQNSGNQFGAYFWDFADGAEGFGPQTEHVYTTTGTFPIMLNFVSSDSSCTSDFVDTVTIISNTIQTYSLGGSVTATGNPLDNGYATLFKLDGNFWQFVEAQSITSSYSFDGLEMGTYLVHAIPERASSFAQSHQATYYGGATEYASAASIMLTASESGYDIALLEATNQTSDQTWDDGADELFGFVVLASGNQNKGIPGETTTTLDENDVPLQNAVVTLYNDLGERLAFTTTDEFGYYSFENLNAGDYTITIEYAGVIEVQDVEIALDGDDLTSEDVPPIEVIQTLITSSSDIDGASQVVLYPVPANQTVYVLGTAVMNATLVDMTGIHYTLAVDANSIILSSVAAGHYMLLLTNEEGVQTTHLISVQR